MKLIFQRMSSIHWYAQYTCHIMINMQLGIRMCMAVLDSIKFSYRIIKINYGGYANYGMCLAPIFNFTSHSQFIR